MTFYPDGPRQLIALMILLILIPFITFVSLINNARRRVG